MLKKIGPTLIAVGLLASCAKERSYDEVAKTSDLKFSSALQSKQTLLDMCSLDDPCLYLPSVTNTPFEVTASRAFWQGEQRVVVSNLDDQGKLQFLQVEKDSRFQNNINNTSPVLNIEVKHVDYRCKEDDFGDCTNKEEVDKEKNWKNRKYVQIEDIDVIETNTLPIEFGEMFGNGCFTEVDKTIQKMDIEKTAINLVVKKTYKASLKCSSISTYDELMEKLRYLTFSVDYAYSIVKLSTLTDKKYQAIDYPASDESKFGFFTTKQKFKTVDNHDHYMGTRKTLMNRWSPNKKEIVYHLNSDFYLPEMKNILASTENAIDTVNKSLSIANAGIQIKLVKGDDSKIGDLRQNFIVLVKDPQASGVIGYGPSVANPETGEILNARTVMYYGSIQKYVGRAYDELIDEVIKIAQAQADAAAAANAAQNTSPAQNSGAAQNTSNVAADIIEGKVSLEYSDYVTQRFDESNIERIFNTEEDRTFTNSPDVLDHGEVYAQFKRSILNKENKAEDMIAKLAEKTFYHGSQVNYDEIVIQELLQDIANKKQIAKWDNLPEDKRKYYMEKLLPYTWVPTLVHEFGHNLGLRHNFYGSTDTDNFYNLEESNSLGMRKEVTYSSIMDYAPKTNNELKVMGKYDVAALRFAYAREVESSDGKMVNISKTLTESLEKGDLQLKGYKYCSDEHVANNPLCNRHDEGTSFEEVIDYHIAQFKKNYERVNFRNRRYSFEARRGDQRYFSYLIGSFQNIYQFFATYDGVHKNGSYDDPKWEDNEQLVDIKKASDKAFNFFMNIIEEPAYHCVEFDPKAGAITKVAPFVEMAKGTQLEKFGITFDIAKGCMFLNSYGREGMAYAEFGKYLNNSLDLRIPKTETMQGDTSQMDVRGMWQDKILATLFTGLRATQLTTVGAASAGNFFDYPEYKERLEKTLDGIMTNSMVKPVEVTLPSGDVQTIPMQYSFESNHKVNQSYNRFINAVMGLRDSRTNLKSVMMRFLKMQLLNDQNEGDVDSQEALASYYVFDADRVSTRHDLSRYKYDKFVEFSNADGVVNYRFGIYTYNTKAMELAKLKDSMELIQLAKKSNVELAPIVIAEQVLDYLKSKKRLSESDISKLIKDGVSLETIEKTGKFSPEEIVAIRGMFENGAPPINILEVLKTVSLYSKAQIETFSKLPTQYEMLVEAGVVTVEDAEEVKVVVGEGIDAIKGVLEGTLNQQVLLSSFLALTK